MKCGRIALTLALTMLAPLPALAQGGTQGQGRGMGGAMAARLLVDQGSVEYLVTKSEDLKLTADQTKRLEVIGAAYSASTRESREQIRSMLPQPGQAAGGDREAMMQRMQQVRPLADKLIEDDQKSLDEAILPLDDAQKEKVKALLDERRQNARPRRGGAS
jgi:hypothetical protein